MKRLSILILATCLAVMTAAAWAAGGVLGFVDQAEVNSARISLADLVAPGAKVSARLMAQMAKLDLGEAPSLRWGLKIPGYKLRAALSRVKMPQGVSVLIPRQVAVTRASQRLSSNEMAEIYLKALNRRLGRQAKNVDIHSLSAARDLTLPSGRLSTRVRFVGNRLSGRVPAVIEVLVGGSRVGQARVAASVDHFGDVVVAAHSIPSGRSLGPKDLQVVRSNLSRVKVSYASDPRGLIGMRTRSPIGVGEPVNLVRLVRPLLVRRGEVVNMIIKVSGMHVSAKGKAQQSGFKDERIRLTNLRSKREVYGTIVAAGTIAVDF